MKKLLIKLALWYLNKHGVYPASIDLKSLLYFNGGFYEIGRIHHSFSDCEGTELDIMTKRIEPPVKK